MASAPQTETEDDPYAPDANGYLNLREQNLERVPEEVRRHADRLRTLDLAKNHLTHLPDWIGELPELETLFVWENQLEVLPPSIGRLGKLRHLDLTGNQFRELPGIVREMAGSLRELYFDRNLNTEIPDWLVEMSDLIGLGIGNSPLDRGAPPSLEKLHNLRYLVYTGYYGNDDGSRSFRLTEVPSWITSLTSLEDLDLGNHRLTDLPRELAYLENLTSLKIWNNGFREIPTVIFDMPVLQRLDMAINQVEKIPPEIARLKNLEDLGLGTNRLSDLPPEIGTLSNLKFLRLDLNRFSTIPDPVFQLTQLQELEIGSRREIGGEEFTEIPAGIARLSALKLLKIDQDHSLRGDQKALLASGGASAVRDQFRSEQRRRLSGQRIGLVRPLQPATETTRLVDRCLRETGCTVVPLGSDSSLEGIAAVLIQEGGPLGDQIARQARSLGIPVLPLAWSGLNATRLYVELFPEDEVKAELEDVPVYSERAYGQGIAESEMA